MSNNIRSLKTIMVVALLSLFVLSTQAFAQGLRGTITDPTKAVVANANITATHVDTNTAAKATTNNQGLFNLMNLQTGEYEVRVEAPGYAPDVKRVRVRLDTLSHNVTLRPGAETETVSVKVDGYTQLLEEGASAGTVLQEEMLLALPLLSGNVMDLINVMGGVQIADDPIWGAESTTFAGVPAAGVNIMRDGITVSEVRYNSGIATPARMNTEMLGEMKLILSPVDAEYGFGTGQIIMSTRSGSNAFHGSGVWNIQNTALDSLEWEVKARRTYNAARTPDWRNLNNYTLTASGPIIRDKAFFTVSWDHQLSRTRAWATTEVFTECARQGIYRYLGLSGPANATGTDSAPQYRGVPLRENVADALPYMTDDGKDAARMEWAMAVPSVYSDEPDRWTNPLHADGMPRREYTFGETAVTAEIRNSRTQNYIEWARAAYYGDDGGDRFDNDFGPSELYYKAGTTERWRYNVGSPRNPAGETIQPFSAEERARYTVMPGGSSGEDWSDGYIIYSLVDEEVKPRLYYQSLLGPIANDPNGNEIRRLLGGIANSNEAAEGSWVYNGCKGDRPGLYTFEPGKNYDGGWDKWRNGLDASPFIAAYSDPERFMPPANDFSTAADALNKANLGWVRTAETQDTIFGTVYDANRKQVTGRVDYNINYSHRLGANYQYERNSGGSSGNNKVIPNGYSGSTDRRPQLFNLTLNSTISTSLMNELRGGLSRTNTYNNTALTNPRNGDTVRNIMLELLPTKDFPRYNDVILASPANTPTLPYYWGSAAGSTWGGVDDRWTIADTVTWMKGAHNFRGGFEYRLVTSAQDQSGSGANTFGTASNIFPQVQGGVLSSLSAWSGIGDLEGDNAFGPYTGLKTDFYDSSTPQTNAMYDPNRDWKNAGVSDYYSCDSGAGPGCSGNSTSTIFTNARNLLSYLSGSVSSISQYFFVVLDENKVPRWNEPSAGELTYKVDIKGKELAFFFKDDWRVRSDLTLNLGVRWEYYGLPYVSDGRAAGLKGGLQGAYGISQRNENWMPDWNTLTNPGTNDAFPGCGYDPDGQLLSDYGRCVTNRANDPYKQYGTEQIFIGPNSPNEDVSIFNKQFNNWAPSVGFSWQLPWFGRGRTALRAGYQISYRAISNYDNNTGFGNVIGQNNPGMNYGYTYNGIEGCLNNDERKKIRLLDGRTLYEADRLSDDVNQADNECYMSFANIGHLLPLQVPSSRIPMGNIAYQDSIRPDNRGTTSISVYDPNIRNPYSQSLNVSVSRNVGNVLTINMRYVGTLSRKTTGTINPNLTNYINNGLFQEFWNLRAGVGNPKSRDDFPILNSGIIPYKGCRGIEWDRGLGALRSCADENWPTASLYAPVLNGALVEDLSGAEQVLYQSWNNLAVGNFQSVASGLATANFATNLRSASTNQLLKPAGGALLRPDGTPGAWLPTVPSGMSSGQVLRAGWAPDNLIRANPQYDMSVTTNRGRSHYHSMMLEVTLRATRGLSFQSTLTWSKTISRSAVLDWNDPQWTLDKTSAGRNLQLNTYGTYELPFGARGFFFRDVSGVTKKLIEGWNLSWIGNARSGSTMSLGSPSQASLWSTSKWVQVGAFDPKSARMGPWNKRTNQTNYFPRTYVGTEDPVCTSPLIGANVNNSAVSSSSQTMRTRCASGDGSYDFGMRGVSERTAVPNAAGTGTVNVDRLIYQNAIPGEIGNVMSGTIYGPGRWSLDATMAKNIQFLENKTFELRIDATNIFNNAAPSYDNSVNNIYGTANASYGARAKSVAAPNSTVPATSNTYANPFGHVNSKAGHRTFQARIRVSF